MTANGWLQLGLYLALLMLLAKPLRRLHGRRLRRPPDLARRRAAPVRAADLSPLRHRSAGRDALDELRRRHALVERAGFVAVYLLQRFQTLLPLNPQALGPVTPDSSFNTAVSFATNTNWQGYGGETTMSDLTQMLGLNVQNFVSAAAGMAALVALIRGLAGARSTRSATSGSTSCDPRFTSCCRFRSCCRYCLSRRGSCRRSHPIKTFRCCKRPATSNLSWTKTGGAKDADDNPIMETVSVAEQTLPMGPAASQIAIKQFGTNGGGFFNVNSSHPLENPTPVSNLLEMLSILLISAALCYTFGAMVGDTRQGWALLAAMTIVFVALTIPCMLLEQPERRSWPSSAPISPPAVNKPAATWKAKKLASAW